METYGEMVFCTAKDCAGFNNCHRALSMRVESDAKGYGLPIAIFCEPPVCYKPLKENKK